MSRMMFHITKRTIRCVCILLFCVIFLFTGCGQAETAGETSSDTQTEDVSESGKENEAAVSVISCEFTDVYLRITEPYGSSYVLNGNVSMAEVGGHIYQFASAVTEEDSLFFIQAQEALCAFLEENGILTEGMTYRVLNDYTNWTDSDEMTAYFGMDTLESWEQVLTTIQVSLGNYTNYGYLYALANDVAEELGWGTDLRVLTEDGATAGATAAAETTGADGSEENITVDLFREDPYLLNLVYPCFDLAYEDEETIQVCKALALQILDRLTDLYCGEEAFVEEIEAWAQEQGIDFTPTYLRFAYYSESCPLKLTTRYLEVYRTGSFTGCEWYLSGIETKNWLGTVENMIHTFEWLDEKLTVMSGKFDITSIQRVSVQMVSELSVMDASNGGLCVYDGENAIIYATDVTYLFHECVHYLYNVACGCLDPAYEDWCNEVTAWYYASLYTVYEYILCYSENVDSDYLTEIEETLGEAFDEPVDYILWTRINAREEEESQYLFYINQLAKGGRFKIAFGEYFGRTYGEEAFLNSMMYPSRVEEYTGKTMDEIFDDWELDMADPEMDALVSYLDWLSY